MAHAPEQPSAGGAAAPSGRKRVRIVGGGEDDNEQPSSEDLLQRPSGSTEIAHHSPQRDDRLESLLHSAVDPSSAPRQEDQQGAAAEASRMEREDSPLSSVLSDTSSWPTNTGECLESQASSASPKRLAKRVRIVM